ncbi:hypothetical protein CVT25_011119 [Psilocybe cyanescens]|uniref:Uncharacterized protein n=1 Tax=Psilocybe cyanescens TaxID=93625 RepID=A0A409WGM5_PSICY|nr:hypothetical protein CVT25_011119 [Psilocybe cyanescens]
MDCATTTSDHDHSSGSDPRVQTSKPPVRVDKEKPTLAYLKRLGIKIRDFAYESTLPPVPTYRIQSRQIQPAIPRQLQRQSTEPDDGSQPMSQGTQQLERRLTEPALAQETPARMPAYANPLNAHLTIDAGGFINAPATHISTNQSYQASTGNWHPYSQAGHSQLIQSQPSESSLQTIAAIFSSSPLTPLPSSPINGTQTPNLLSTLSNCLINSTYDMRSPAIPRVIAPRYALRKRPASTTVSSPKPPKRVRMSAPSESPLRSRPQSKSANSKKKPRNESSPSSRALSKRASNDGKGKRKRA